MSETPPDAPARRVSFGAASMALSSLLRVVIQIAVLPIIGRILGPHAYGEVALVSPFIFFSMLLAESGLGACIVRADAVTPALEGTVFCFSAMMSLTFIGLFALLAWPLGRLMNEPSFPLLLIGMSSILLFSAFAVVPGALLMRAKKFHWMAMSDIASSVGSLGGVILGISLGWGVWSLVAQQVGLWTGKLIVIFLGSHARPRLIFDLAIIRQNVHFSSNLTASSIVSFVARNIDNVLIGKFMGAETLGFYALAFQIVGIPSMVLSGSVYSTIFTATSEAKREGSFPTQQFLSTLRGIALICMPAICGLAATAYLSVPLVLGDKWAATSVLIVLLSVYGLAQTFGSAMSAAINGLGRADLILKIGLTSASAVIVGILIGVTIGSDAVAIGVSLTALTFPFLTVRVLTKEGDFTIRDVVHSVWAPLVSSLIMAAGVVILQKLLPPSLPIVVDLGLCIGAGGVFYIGSLLLLFRDSLRSDFVLIKATLLSRRSRARTAV